MTEKFLFVDRDGTLVAEPSDEQVDRLEKIRLLAGVIPALRKLIAHGYRLVMVTNQDGLGTDSFPTADFELCQNFIVELFRSQGVTFERVLVCPHRPLDGCRCRKPGVGLVLPYLSSGRIDLERSAVVGDRASDVELAEAMGLRSFVVSSQLRRGAVTWDEIAHVLTSEPRRATVERKTKETTVRVAVDLDGEPAAKVATGIGFFDHMLEQLARHGRFTLDVAVTGDLHVDEHHTVEDTALALGEAIRRALGDKRGIGRYGFLLPMDEALAQVAIDLSGRALTVFEATFTREAVGGLPTELVGHFFRSLADGLGATLHVAVKGDNCHHMIEATFKGVARALAMALARTGETELPSTKGVL